MVNSKWLLQVKFLTRVKLEGKTFLIEVDEESFGFLKWLGEGLVMFCVVFLDNVTVFSALVG